MAVLVSRGRRQRSDAVILEECDKLHSNNYIEASAPLIFMRQAGEESDF